MMTELTLKEKAEQIVWALHDPDPTIRARVYMQGCSNRNVGYGNHFVELVLALCRLGADVRLYPEFLEPPLPAEFLACLLEPWDFDAPVGVHIANPTQLKRVGAHSIGITTWETTRLPPDEFRRSVSAVDEILVPCQDNIAVFQSLVPDDVPVTYLPEGVDHDFFSYVDREWDAEPLKIGMFGALSYRKGVDLGIEAFVDLFANDPRVELHIATTFYKIPQFYHLPNMYSNVFVEFVGWYGREKIRDWYQDKHALFSPYRGEGWYMPGCEMMATGGILIAPDKMGAQAYHSSNTGLVIPSHWGPVLHWSESHGEEAKKRYGEWIEYDEKDIRDTLQAFVDMPYGDKKLLSERAAMQIPHLASWDYAGEKLLNHIIDGYRQVAA